MNDYNSAIKILVTLKYSGTIKIAGVMWGIDNDADTFQRWGMCGLGQSAELINWKLDLQLICFLWAVMSSVLFTYDSLRS